MGDPRKHRKKYSTPMHPWQAARIAEEKKLVEEYGLKNKKEIWKIRSLLKNFFSQVKKSIAATGKQAETEKNQFLTKLQKLGLLKKTAKLDDVLVLTLNDLMEKRLQTFVFRKGFAHSIKQARQFITHGHVVVRDKKITSPSYLVTVEDENQINFVQSSKLADLEHPERVIKKKKAGRVIKKKTTKRVRAKDEKRK